MFFVAYQGLVLFCKSQAVLNPYHTSQKDCLSLPGPPNGLDGSFILNLSPKSLDLYQEMHYGKVSTEGKEGPTSVKDMIEAGEKFIRKAQRMESRFAMASFGKRSLTMYSFPETTLNSKVLVLNRSIPFIKYRYMEIINADNYVICTDEFQIEQKLNYLAENNYSAEDLFDILLGSECVSDQRDIKGFWLAEERLDTCKDAYLKTFPVFNINSFTVGIEDYRHDPNKVESYVSSEFQIKLAKAFGYNVSYTPFI